MSSEKSLYDMLVIHQVLLEHVKNNFDAEFIKQLPKFVRELRRLFSKLKYKNLGDMTRRELNSFTKTAEKLSNKFYNSYLNELNKSLRDFTSADKELQILMVANDLDKEGDSVIDNVKNAENEVLDNEVSSDKDREYPLTWLFGEDDSKLYESIFNRPMTFSGRSAKEELDKLKLFVSGLLVGQISKSWANNETSEEAQNGIFGTEENNLKDGILLNIERSNSSILRTIQQSISIQVSSAIQSLVYNKYIWISILDNRTTEICRYLNGRTFVYGNGPLPPRHVRCRSKIAPASSGVPSEPESFFAWLKKQSHEDQIATVGIRKANKLRDGNLSEIDFLEIDKSIRLKPSELRDKIKLLTR